MFWGGHFVPKKPKNTIKIYQNDKFSKFSKINFFIMAWDMNIGVIPDENTSLRCVLNHPSPFHHAHNRNPPPTYPHRQFLAIFREVWNKMPQKIKFLVNTCWPKIRSVVRLMKCAHLKYDVNTVSTSREILFYIPLAHKPVLENLTFNSCFSSFFKLAKNEIHVFWVFLSLQKMKFMFFEGF